MTREIVKSVKREKGRRRRASNYGGYGGLTATTGAAAIAGAAGGGCAFLLSLLQRVVIPMGLQDTPQPEKIWFHHLTAYKADMGERIEVALQNTAIKKDLQERSRDLIVFCGGVGSTLQDTFNFAERLVALVRHKLKRHTSNVNYMQAVGVQPQPRPKRESILRIAQKHIDTNLDYVAQALEKESNGGRIALVGHSLGGFSYQAARLAFLLVRIRAVSADPHKITWIGCNTFSSAAAILSSRFRPLKHVCAPV